MRIKVRAYTALREYTDVLPPGGAMEVEEGLSVGEVLVRLGVPSEIPKVILVNGRHREETYLLGPDDEVVIFQPMEGG